VEARRRGINALLADFSPVTRRLPAASGQAFINHGLCPEFEAQQVAGRTGQDDREDLPFLSLSCRMTDPWLQYSLKKNQVLLGPTGEQWEQKIVSELDPALNQWVDSVPDHRKLKVLLLT